MASSCRIGLKILFKSESPTVLVIVLSSSLLNISGCIDVKVSLAKLSIVGKFLSVVWALDCGTGWAMWIKRGGGFPLAVHGESANESLKTLLIKKLIDQNSCLFQLINIGILGGLNFNNTRVSEECIQVS